MLFCRDWANSLRSKCLLLLSRDWISHCHETILPMCFLSSTSTCLSFCQIVIHYRTSIRDTHLILNFKVPFSLIELISFIIHRISGILLQQKGIKKSKVLKNLIVRVQIMFIYKTFFKRFFFFWRNNPVAYYDTSIWTWVQNLRTSINVQCGSECLWPKCWEMSSVQIGRSPS